jgi:hypothetical protein
MLALAGSLLLEACGPSASIPRAQAEQEVGAYMLDTIIREQIGMPWDYTRTAGQPWSMAPDKVDLIVWSPVEKFSASGIKFMDRDKALHVWWLAGKQLTEVTSDKAAAVQDYRNTRMMRRPDPTESAWGWGYFEYGILSMSEGNRTARVYMGISCGPLCGQGTIYTLERDASGTWTITNSEMRWIS